MSIWMWLLAIHVVGAWVITCIVASSSDRSNDIIFLLTDCFELLDDLLINHKIILWFSFSFLWEMFLLLAIIIGVLSLIAKKKYIHLEDLHVNCPGEFERINDVDPLHDTDIGQPVLESASHYICKACGQSYSHRTIEHIIKYGHETDSPEYAKFKKSFWNRFVHA